MAGYDPFFREKLFDIIKYPESISIYTVIIEIIVYTLTALLIYHGYKTMGKKKILLFFTGTLLSTLLMENFWIIFGYQSQYIEGWPRNYYYNYHTYIFWIIAVPVTVVCAWFILIYSSSQIAEQAISTGKLKKALTASVIGTTIDFVIDPIVIRRYAWLWLKEREETLWILQVPSTNFIGWFIIVATFNYFFMWYWSKFMERHENWGVLKTGAFFYMFIIVVLLFTLSLTLGFAILLIPFYGVDLSWWTWPY